MTLSRPRMPTSSPTLICGNARFTDTDLATLARAAGVEAAWRQTLLQNDVAKALRGVHGDFAVGLQLEGARTILAVDRFAVCSMCYCIRDGKLHFAAQADRLAGPEAAIDPQAIFDYLYFHVIPSPRTIYQGIFRLPPGYYAVFENGQLTVAPYWEPSFQEAPNASFAELKQEFRALLGTAVQRQLDGSKVACFLSGGTDSSTVSGMANAVGSNTAHTYSIGFDAQGYDEMAFARIAARHFKTQHHEYYVTPEDLVRSIPAVAAHYDQPFGNSSAVPAYYCAKMARDDGVTRILAGDGGDELFGGNTRYAKQKIFGWYDSIPGAIRRSLLDPASATSVMQQIPLVRKGASYVNQARVPMPDRMMTYNLLLRLGAHNVLTPALLAQVNEHGPVQQQREVWQQTPEGSLVNRMLAFDWRFTLADCDLPKVVGTTELAGLSVGFPMLDDDLLAFSERLPTEYKLKGLQLRWFFKEALRGFLPDEIIVKKKQGFGLPFGVWANGHAALKALASDSLQSLASRGVVRQDFVNSLMTQRLPEHPGYYGEMIWILMMLEQWFAAKAPAYRLAS